MTIKIEPRSRSTGPVEATPAPAKETGPVRPTAGALAGMERPATMPTPRGSQSQPVPGRPGSAISTLQKQTQALLARIRAGGADARQAAQEALRLAGSFAFRRSRGARRAGADLLGAVAEEEPELAPLTTRLGDVLTAEAALHELSADGTLRALVILVALLEDGQDQGAVGG